MAEELLPFDIALDRLLALAPPLPATEIPIGDAAGLVLAAPHAARLTQPPVDVSAMDGYALRFAELPGPFRVAGESAAGRPLETVLAAGEAARIFTGAAVPAGADTVAVQEDAVAEGERVSFPHDGPPGIGAHIRRAGIDFTPGLSLAQAGQRLAPPRLALLASAGLGTALVHRRPRVAILSTGDELVPPGQMPGPGQIIGANGLMIATLLSAAGADVQDFGIIPDQQSAIESALKAAAGHDLIVTIGGASVGDHDLVRPALLAAGAQLDYWRVAIRPGKPFLAGRLGAALVAGLPGNPASAFICARLFLIPLLRHLAGLAEPRDTPVMAQLTEALPANGHRKDHVRAGLHADGRVAPFARQDSSLLSVLAGANALILRPPFAPAAAEGATVPVLTL